MPQLHSQCYVFIDCLAQPGKTDEHISLTRELNLVTVCIVVAAYFVGSLLLTGPLWLEGSQFSPGHQSLSCPIDLQSLKHASYPGEMLPQFFPSSPLRFSKCQPS